MTQAIRIHIDNQDRLAGLRSFLATVMEKTEIEAMLVPTRLAVKNRIMPTLVSDPKRLAEADPLSPAQLRERYNLEQDPARVVFGTIMKRQTVIAPTRGVVMIVAFRLEFYDPASRDSTVVMVAVRDLAERCIPLAVEELVRQLDGGAG